MIFIRPLIRYADFKGRASRTEFWGFYLFLMFASGFCIMLPMLGLGKVAEADSGQVAARLGFALLLPILFSLGTFVPYMAAMVRRLHDSDRSGWWLLLVAPSLLVPLFIVGGLVAAAAGAAGANDDAMRGAFVSAFMGAILIILPAGLCNLVLMALLVIPGTRGENRFGHDPRGPNGFAGGGASGGGVPDFSRIDDLIEQAKQANQAGAAQPAAARPAWSAASPASAAPTFGRRGA